MKLLRCGAAGKERPAMLDRAGRLRDLSGVIEDITPEVLAPARMAALAKLDPESLPALGGRRRIGVPVNGIGKFVAIGLNYSDHAAEANMPIPTEPVVFMKTTSSLCGPGDPIVLPRGSRKTDWEVELGVIIGRKAKYVPRERALSHVAGYCVVNDVSERAFQLERGGLWDKGKGCDTFGPVGPWLVTPDEVGDPQALSLWLDVNGKRMQSGTTAKMIFDVAHLVSYLSEFMSLMPGDLITTGTPPGVGMGKKPQRFLKPGDQVQAGVEGLGEQRQTVREAG